MKYKRIFLINAFSRGEMAILKDANFLRFRFTFKWINWRVTEVETLAQSLKAKAGRP